MAKDRAGDRCEYCRAPSNIGQSYYGVEHIEPRAAGGGDDPENLAWSCQGCNNSKGTATEAVDPVVGEPVRLFHPRRDSWKDHFAWDDTFTHVVGLSPTGRATIERLRLNRPGLVALRRLLREVGEHPQ